MIEIEQHEQGGHVLHKQTVESSYALPEETEDEKFQQTRQLLPPKMTLLYLSRRINS
jgi:hypothetical protein